MTAIEHTEATPTPLEPPSSALERAGIPIPKFLRLNHAFGAGFFAMVWFLAASYADYSQVMMLTILSQQTFLK